MLAKMWKKILLAICIIACLFNLVSKLVNRHSLETNLKSANDGNTIVDSLKTEDEEDVYSNNVEENIIINEQEDDDEAVNNENIDNEDESNADSENTETEDDTSDTEDEEKEVYKASDFTIIF